MADNTYEIYFNLPDGGASNKAVSVSSTDMHSAQNTEQQSYLSQNVQSAQGAVRKIISVGTATAVADKLITNELNVVSLRTGAKEYEQKLQFGYSMIKQTAMPLVFGAATGGLAGAATGGPAGAAIGVVFSFAMQGIQWAQNQRVIDYNRDIENIAIGFARNRAGVDSSRGTRQ